MRQTESMNRFNQIDQFSITALQYVNATHSNETGLHALPSDLETTSYGARITNRAIAKSWTVYVFLATVGVLLLWGNFILLFVLKQKIVSPNTSSFGEVDISSKPPCFSIPPENHSDEVNNLFGNNVEGFSSMLRGAGLGNSESKAIIGAVKHERIRVITMERPVTHEKILVLVSGNVRREELSELMEGTTYN